MSDKNKEQFGTTLEKGKIVEKTGDTYKVQSYERPEVTTPPIAPILPQLEIHHADYIEKIKPEYTPGDSVVFFLFDDGTGGIVCRM